MGCRETLFAAIIIGLMAVNFAGQSLNYIPAKALISDSYSVQNPSAPKQVHEKLMNSFFENIGQVDNEDILYYGILQEGFIGFGVGKIYLWNQGTETSIVLFFDGAEYVKPRGTIENQYVINQFTHSNGEYADIRTYQGVRYDSLWSGVNLTFYTTKEGVKYELIFNPEVDLTEIGFRFEYYESLTVDDNSVKIRKGDGLFIKNIVKASQTNRILSASFITLNSMIFRLRVFGYDRSAPLSIDVQFYSIIVGGSDDECTRSMTVDADGNVYVTGGTLSTNFPTVNPINGTFGGNFDCFILKLSSDGNSILFSTFIGGRDYDCGVSIALDKLGNVYVAGTTRSIDFPIRNALYDTYIGRSDCFLVKLNPNGTTLLYSTFIGSQYNDNAADIAVDDAGCVYMTGATKPTFPLLNAYDDSYNGGAYDCFVLKLNANGSSLLFSTFIGGADTDHARAIAIDDQGNSYVCGYTWSTDFPTYHACYDSHNGESDCFVFKLSANGSILSYSTYIGGGNSEYAYSIVVDSSGFAYVTGETWSEDFPTVNLYNTTYAGLGDCFIFKLNEYGDTILYSTFIGGANNDGGRSIVVDAYGITTIVGDTKSPQFPVKSAYDYSFNGKYDCFVLELNTSCDNLLSSTFVGGNNNDRAWSVSIDSLGGVYMTGVTYSENFPNTTDFELSSVMPDCFIIKLKSVDSDNDGLADILERNIGTNPYHNDTDSDQMPDKWEFDYGLNPLIDDSYQDMDNDGLFNLDEFLYGTNPLLVDTDGDNLSDTDEVRTYYTNPTMSDTDEDGLNDSEEIMIYNTNPLTNDTDNDILTDSEELFIYGTDPRDNDTDTDGVNDGLEILFGFNPLIQDVNNDNDGDGLISREEIHIGTNPFNVDSDGDGLFDGWEVGRGLNPLLWTRRTGESFELLFISLVIAIIGMIVASVVMRFVNGKLVGRGHHVRSRPLLIPSLVFLLVIALLSPMDVHGLSDPGSNVVIHNISPNSPHNFSFEVKDSPYYLDTVKISATSSSPIENITSVSIQFESKIDNHTLSLDLIFSSIGNMTAITDIVRLPTGDYNTLIVVNGSQVITIEICQTYVDVRNLDQREWPVMKLSLLGAGIGILVLGIIIQKNQTEDSKEKIKDIAFDYSDASPDSISEDS